MDNQTQNFRRFLNRLTNLIKSCTKNMFCIIKNLQYRQDIWNYILALWKHRVTKITLVLINL